MPDDSSGQKDQKLREIEFFDRIAPASTMARKMDVMMEYYLPRCTFGEQGKPGAFSDNRFFLYRKWLDSLKAFEGKKVLNVACGSGGLSLYLAHCGMDVVAFDFSPVAVEYARELARVSGYADRIRVDLMDISSLSYDPESFDLVTGEAALHHVIKYQNCFENLYRVLKPGGVAIFFESFRFDPLIQFMRPIVWHWKRYVGEYTLGAEDLAYAARVFDRVTISDHAVFYTYSRFFRNPSRLNRKIARTLKALDDAILPRIPFLKRFYSLAYMELHKKSARC